VTKTPRIPLAILLVTILACGANGQTHTKQFDGTWWLRTSSDERSGFIEGTSDCMTWVAHIKNFNQTSFQMEPRITQYLGKHLGDRRLLVVDLWSLAFPDAKPVADAPGGETYKNPHWYLDDSWWGQIGPDEQQGYIEGYVACANTHSPEKYTHSASYYLGAISRYLGSHPPRAKLFIGDLLRRYRDQ